MNCQDWEERLALYQGGDLSPAETVQVERHLGECPGCQLFVSGLQEAQELLREWHGEALDQAHFTAVRSRVLEELERPVGQTIAFCGLSASWRRPWALVFAAVAAALLVALAVLPPVRPRLKSTAPAMRATLTPPDSPVRSTATPTVVPPLRVSGQSALLKASTHQKRPRPKTPTGEPVLIKVVSADPDVVIYWIANTRGD